MIAIAYVDGFNLYNGAVRNTPYKWLDLGRLCNRFAPAGCQIAKIMYFTALVKPRPNDPGLHIRQQIYLRALSTLPDFHIVFGDFRPRPTMLPLCDPNRISPPPRQPISVPVVSTTHGVSKSLSLPLDIAAIQKGRTAFVPVLKTEEKGSDVNLATHLVRDAFREEYDAAIIVSNDSDLAEPIRLVKQELGKHITIVTPYRRTPAAELQRLAEVFRYIPESVLKACQFPPVLQDGQGRFQKPAQW